jgi:hypothetical protein
LLSEYVAIALTKTWIMKSKRHFTNIIYAGIVAISMLSSCEKDSEPDVVVIEANGNISAKVDEFRQLLGATLNTAPGAVGGRREINWEGVPDSLLGQTLPNDFFNPAGNDPALAVRQRGLEYEPTGNFMVSKVNFEEINSQAAGQFSAFSGSKTFANVNSDLWNITPEVPGQDVAATVKGFGIVFSDVDVANSTFIEFFSEQKSLGKFYVPVRTGSSSHSFLGVYFKKEKVTKIRVGHDGVLGDGGKDVSQQAGAHDLITLDDFLYDEPVVK